MYVFLGGSCNPTTWRKEVAIPMLEAASVKYYNPQVDEWTPELVDIERRAKINADVLLFVIDGQTRAIASMIEAINLAHTNSPIAQVVVVIEQIPDRLVIEGQTITGRELKDLNRAREYFRDALTGLAYIRNNVEDAVKKCIELIKAEEE